MTALDRFTLHTGDYLAVFWYTILCFIQCGVTDSLAHYTCHATGPSGDEMMTARREELPSSSEHADCNHNEASTYVPLTWVNCVRLYLEVVIDTVAVGGLQLERGEGVVDRVSTGSLDGPAALGVGWVVIGEVQRLQQSTLLACDRPVVTP